MSKEEEKHNPPSQGEKWWAVVRLVLGLLQVIGATVSVSMLIQLGVTAESLSAVALTCLLTTISVIIFGRRKD